MSETCDACTALASYRPRTVNNATYWVLFDDQTSHRLCDEHNASPWTDGAVAHAPINADGTLGAVTAS